MREIDQALGKTLVGAVTGDDQSRPGWRIIELGLSDGSNLIIEGEKMVVRRKEPMPRKLTLEERIKGFAK